MSATLCESLPCVSCGYELHGLKDDGACPECGTSIARSLRGDRLVAADPRWLRGIARGQRLVAAGLLAAMLGAVLAVLFLVTFVLIVFGKPGLPVAVENAFTVAGGVSLLAVPIGLCIGAVGVFLVTAQEGRDVERESPWSARNVARWGALGAIAACVGVLLASYLPVFGTAWVILDLTFKMGLVVFMTIAGVALLKRLAVLVRRVPDDPLARRIEKTWRFIRWAVPAAGIYLLVLPVMGGVGGGAGGGIGLVFAPVACVGFVAVIGLLLTAVRLVSIMRQCAAHFRFCLAVSESTA